MTTADKIAQLRGLKRQADKQVARIHDARRKLKVYHAAARKIGLTINKEDAVLYAEQLAKYDRLIQISLK